MKKFGQAAIVITIVIILVLIGVSLFYFLRVSIPTQPEEKKEMMGCESILNEPQKSDCFLNLALQTKQVAYCNQTISPDHCYFNFSISTNDRSVCTLINSDLKEDCEIRNITPEELSQQLTSIPTNDQKYIFVSSASFANNNPEYCDVMDETWDYDVVFDTSLINVSGVNFVKGQIRQSDIKKELQTTAKDLCLFSLGTNRQNAKSCEKINSNDLKITCNAVTTAVNCDGISNARLQTFCKAFRNKDYAQCIQPDTTTVANGVYSVCLITVTNIKSIT